MRLVADSGSTKTDWMLLGQPQQGGEGISCLFHTQGLNPIHMTDQQMEEILRGELLPQLGGNVEHVDAVFFYGAGVRADQESRVAHVLAEALAGSSAAQGGHVSAHSDLWGAARALCGHAEGIACILGTGANSCLYDGRGIVANTPALGYVLGDEGSGAVLGRLFLNALFKGRLSEALRKEFCAWAGMSLSDVIDRVYRQPLANRWLASLAPFIHEHLSEEPVRRLVIDNFVSFFHNNLDPYKRSDLPVAAVGSVGWHFRDCLEEAARLCGYQVGKVLKAPIDGLASYHSADF